MLNAFQARKLADASLSIGKAEAKKKRIQEQIDFCEYIEEKICEKVNSSSPWVNSDKLSIDICIYKSTDTKTVYQYWEPNRTRASKTDVSGEIVDDFIERLKSLGYKLDVVERTDRYGTVSRELVISW